MVARFIIFSISPTGVNGEDGEYAVVSTTLPLLRDGNFDQDRDLLSL